MAPLLLVVLALVLTGVAPRLMARAVAFRRAPRAALVVWQAVALAAVMSALAAAPAALPLLRSLDVGPGRRGWIGAVAIAASALILGRLLLSGHLVGTRLRAARREHRALVDLLGEAPALPGEAPDGRLRVLAHPTPTAYCLPGLRRRVVLSEGTLHALPPDELGAVLAHERAHLRARHDLILEFFTVLHTAAPPRVRAEAALREVRLLIEVLADRAARRVAGSVPLARALVRLAGTPPPGAGMAAAGSPSTTAARMALLADDDPPGWMAAAMYLFAAGVLALPFALLTAAYRG